MKKSPCFLEWPRTNSTSVDANAKKEKQQIVRDLARELEKFRPIDRIASEIVEELRERVSKSVVYASP